MKQTAIWAAQWTEVAEDARAAARRYERAGNPTRAGECWDAAHDAERCTRTWDAENEETTE